MKHNLHLIIIAHAVLAVPCTAMENKSPIISELATTKDEQYAAFISNNQTIINGDTCRIIDLTTNKTIRTINNTPPKNIINMHPNRKLFALSNSEKIIIYDTETGLEKWNTPLTSWDKPNCMFNPSHPTIFVWHEVGVICNLREYNYDTNEFSPTNITNLILTNFPAMDIHPTEQQICVQDSYIDIYKYDQNNGFITTVKPNNSHFMNRIKYSPNGSSIACASQQAIEIINPTNGLKCILYSLDTTDNGIVSIEFHPNSSVLATLVLERTKTLPKTVKDYNTILRYLDISNKDILAEISLSDLYPCCTLKTRRALSFSPDGTKTMIKLNDRYVVLPVPFKAIYQADTKKILSYFLCILKKYKPDDCNILPYDIIQVLMHNLLETYKR